MSPLVIGNIICFIGCLFMVGSGFMKKKGQILLTQCAQYTFLGIGMLILGGVSGFISDVVSIIRNLVGWKMKFTTPLKVVFIALQVVLTAMVNTMGIIGWLPVIAACIFTWFLDTDSEILLKLLIILAMVTWVVYDWTIKNYATLAFDVLTILSNLYGIFTITKKKA